MSINTNRITWKATEALLKLDDSFVGTEDYFGMTYFWDYEYRIPMRDLTYYQRVLVHKALLKAGLEVNGKSEKHAEIMNKFSRKFRKTLERKYGPRKKDANAI